MKSRRLIARGSYLQRKRTCKHISDFRQPLEEKSRYTRDTAGKMRADSFSTLRQEEFARLDEQEHVYLDYTGAGLHSESSLQLHFSLLQSSLLGNPHSENPTSKLATDLVELARAQVLSFFNADPLQHDVIFTANASAGIKLVGESYPFGRSSRFAMLADNHNSVVGIREFARRSGANITCLPLDEELRATPNISSRLRQRVNKRANNLFAYPAQSNFSGVKHPLHLVDVAHELGYDVFLDASAFVPTNRLDLSVVRPDFVCMSFYKMFGFPTGIGALIARKEALQKLRRPWFAGGTIQFASIQNDMHLLEEGHAGFEDGTVNFLGIPAVSTGLHFLQNVGIERIRDHVAELTEQLLSGLLSLRHHNGLPMVEIYGPKTMDMRGGTVNFDVFDCTGVKVDPRKVETAANANKISLRTGCFCNPGAAEKVHAMDKGLVLRCMMRLSSGPGDFSVEKFSECVGNVYVGSIRVSVGVASSPRDIETFLIFLQSFCNDLGDESSNVSMSTFKHRNGRIRAKTKTGTGMKKWVRRRTEILFGEGS